MSKKKKTIGISIDADLIEEFTKYCKDNGYTKSGLIAKLIKEVLKKERGKSSEVSLWFWDLAIQSKRLLSRD